MLPTMLTTAPTKSNESTKKEESESYWKSVIEKGNAALEKMAAVANHPLTQFAIRRASEKLLPKTADQAKIGAEPATGAPNGE